MPRGTRHDETGWLNENEGQWVLRRDEGGRWRLEVGFFMAWRTRKLLGKRVRVVGKRSDFDWLDVEKIEAL